MAKTRSRAVLVKPGRMRAEERRTQLIGVALQLFATRGFQGTTTKAIAEAAGVSEAIIFRHFATKEDLYEAILQHQAAEDGYDATVAALREAAERGDDEGLVRTLASKVLATYRRDPDFQRVMLFASLDGHAFASLSNRSMGLPIFAFLRDYIATRQAAGVIRQGDPGLIVFSMVAVPVYYAIGTGLFEIDPMRRSDREAVETFTRIIIDGLRSPGTAPAADSSSRLSSTDRTRS